MGHLPKLGCGSVKSREASRGGKSLHDGNLHFLYHRHTLSPSPGSVFPQHLVCTNEATDSPLAPGRGALIWALGFTVPSDHQLRFAEHQGSILA